MTDTTTGNEQNIETPESPEPSENPGEGGWAKLSAKQKQQYKIGAVVAVLLLIVVVRFATHKSASTPAPVIAPVAAAAVTQADITNAERIATTTPSAANYVNLSLVYYRANRYVDCIISARRAIGLKPNFPTAYNNIGSAFNHLYAYDSAITACNMALQLDPNMQLAKNNLANAMKGKEAQEAKIASIRKISTDQPTAENYYNLSVAYYQAWQFDNAIGGAKSALALKPSYVEAYNIICASDNHLGKFAEGKKAAEKALKIEPDNQLAKNNLKWSEEGLTKTGQMTK